jgi:hypothetical protein
MAVMKNNDVVKITTPLIPQSAIQAQNNPDPKRNNKGYEAYWHNQYKLPNALRRDKIL